MNRKRIARIAQTLTALTLLLVTFVWGGGSVAAAPPAVGAVGAVFTLSNTPSGNAVLAFDRAADGALTPAGAYATGGLGSGSGLGSQGALVLSDNRRWLFAVNPGSDDISVFAVSRHGLRLAARAPSGGDLPISLTYHDDLLYVLNAGGVANISGLRFDDGHLQPIAGSTRALSTDNPGPAEVLFSPNGELLAVTEKATSKIDIFRVGRSGLAGAAEVYPAAGTTPFGFDFDRRGHLISSEAAGGVAGAGTASSYRTGQGGLEVTTGALPLAQGAPCWAMVAKNGRYAFIANTGSSTITSLSIEQDGALSLLGSASTGANSRPADMALSHNGQFLYVRNGNGTIGIFAVAEDGGLSALPAVGGVSGAAGLAGY
jgi:6-phosphogluconolactonase